MKSDIFTIDAEGKSFGRVASEAAFILRGKNSPEFERNVVPVNKVEIINASKAGFTPRKLKGKIYLRHSGYPGGQKKATLEKVIEVKGPEFVFETAIYGMLPSNRLRKQIMKNLTIRK